MCGCPCTPPTGDLACNTGMYPDWESNQWPFASQSGAQSTEPHEPGGRVYSRKLLQIQIAVSGKSTQPAAGLREKGTRRRVIYISSSFNL